MVRYSDHDLNSGHPGGGYLNGSVIQMSLFGSPLYCNPKIIVELSLHLAKVFAEIPHAF